MRLIALYKTWDGGEFVDASLSSVYEHCDSIVMVHSDTSWLGEHGNTVKESAVKWCEEHDKAGKVHHVDVSLSSQEAQYEAGLNYIASKTLPWDAVLAVDADEVWEDQYFENAKRFLVDHPYVAYRSNMHTYLKTPFYRVDPPFGSPTTFFRDPRQLLASPRGCQSPAMQLENVWMHHYTYVRETRTAVERKLHQSCLADGGETVVPKWMERVYDFLPAGEYLHAFTRWAPVWNRVEKIWLSDFPKAMLSAKLLPLWLPDGELVAGEQAAIHRLAKGRRQAVDLGTYRGLSAVILSLACDHVHTIDCYDDVAGKGTFADTLDPERYERMSGHSLISTAALCNRFGNLSCEQADTAEAAGHWTGGPIDVLFVDADHSESSTLRNVKAWLPHMATEARIIFHDNNDLHPGVQQALDVLRNDPRFRFIDPGKFSGSLAVAEVMP